MSTPPRPPFFGAASRPSVTYEPPKMSLTQRVLVICGWIVTIATAVLGILIVAYGISTRVPTVPEGAPALERIEAYVTLAMAREQRDGTALLGIMVVLFGMGVGSVTAVAEMHRADARRSQFEAMRKENARLTEQVNDLEKKRKELEKKLHDMLKLVIETNTDMPERRGPGPLFGSGPGRPRPSIFGSRPGTGRPPVFGSPFGDNDDDEDDESDIDEGDTLDNLPPIPPPKKSPSLN